MAQDTTITSEHSNALSRAAAAAGTSRWSGCQMIVGVTLMSERRGEGSIFVLQFKFSSPLLQAHVNLATSDRGHFHVTQFLLEHTGSKIGPSRAINTYQSLQPNVFNVWKMTFADFATAQQVNHILRRVADPTQKIDLKLLFFGVHCSWFLGWTFTTPCSELQQLLFKWRWRRTFIRGVCCPQFPRSIASASMAFLA